MDELVEAIADELRGFDDGPSLVNATPHYAALMRYRAKGLLTALQPKGWVVVPVEPTEEQLNAARDWSVAKYGQGVGNDGAKGCYAAMLSASPMNDLLRAQTRSTEADRSAG